MNSFCNSTINQIQIAVTSIVEIIDTLKEEDLNKRPTPSKHSIGELLEHIVFICKADYHLSKEASEEEMKALYSSTSFSTLVEMKEELLRNMDFLRERISVLTEEDLLQETTSYWGTTYTRFEWLVEIVAHLYHHRGQLHAMLVHCFNKEPHVRLFE